MHDSKTMFLRVLNKSGRRNFNKLYDTKSISLLDVNLVYVASKMLLISIYNAINACGDKDGCKAVWRQTSFNVSLGGRCSKEERKIRSAKR